MKLSSKLITITLIVAAVCIGTATAFAYISIRSALQEQISSNQLQTTKQTIGKIDQLLYERQVNLESIALEDQIRTLLATRNTAPAKVNADLETLRSFAGWNNLNVLDLQGTVRASANSDLIGHSSLTDHASLSGLVETARAGTVAISDLFIDPTDQQPTMSYLAPIRANGAVVGFIEGRVAWSTVLNVLRSVKGPTVRLLDKNGVLLGNNDNSSQSADILKQNFHDTTSFQHAVTNRSGSDVLPSLSGAQGDSVISYAPEPGAFTFPGSGWILVVDTPTKLAFAPAQRMTLSLLLVFTFTVFAGISIILYFLDRQVIRGIGIMSSAMSRVTLGDLTQTVPIHSQDELGRLSQNFNEMIRQLAATHRSLQTTTHVAKAGQAQLEASINSLRQGFILTDAKGQIIMFNTAAQDIISGNNPHHTKTPKLQLVEALAAALPPEVKLTDHIKQTLHKHQPAKIPSLPLGGHFLNLYLSPAITGGSTIGCVLLLEDVTEERIMQRSRDEFFSIASHELRTPLTAIRGNTALIQQYYPEALKDPSLHEMIGDIHESSTRLIEIVNDFLDASRLEQGKMQFNVQNFSVEPIIEKVTYELAGISREKGIYLKFKNDLGTMPLVRGDQNRVKQVVYNLVGNAMKFTETGGVTVEAQKFGKLLKVCITDTGPGISPEGQQLLFHKFQQTGSSILTRDTTRGTGLGLYISKLLIEHMGGKINLEKSELGKGTTFSFTIPISTKKQLDTKPSDTPTLTTTPLKS